MNLDVVLLDRSRRTATVVDQFVQQGGHLGDAFGVIAGQVLLLAEVVGEVVELNFVAECPCCRRSFADAE